MRKHKGPWVNHDDSRENSETKIVRSHCHHKAFWFSSESAWLDKSCKTRFRYHIGQYQEYHNLRTNRPSNKSIFNSLIGKLEVEIFNGDGKRFSILGCWNFWTPSIHSYELVVGWGLHRWSYLLASHRGHKCDSQEGSDSNLAWVTICWGNLLVVDSVENEHLSAFGWANYIWSWIKRQSLSSPSQDNF